MKLLYTLLILLFISSAFAQNINYRVEIVNLKIVGCDDGFGDDEEPTWKVWARDNINTTWQGGICHSSDGNTPYIHVPNATDGLLLNITNTSANSIDIRFEAWEDDNIFGSPGSTDRCNYNSGDDCLQSHNPLVGAGGLFSSINIFDGNMCTWTQYEYTAGDFAVTVRVKWEYTNFSGGSTITGCGNSPVSMNAQGSGTWSIFTGNGGGFSSNVDPTTQFTGNAGDTYQVLWSNLPGCLTNYIADTVDVILYTLPVPNLQANTSTFCEGQEMQFTAQNASNFIFSVNTVGNIVETNATGILNYTPVLSDNAVIVQINNGNCTATETANFTVNNSPNPQIIISSPNLQSATMFPFYQWYLNGSAILGATSQTFTPTVNGLYTLEVGLANGCTNSVDYLFSSLSMDENSVDFSIYPNPTQNSLFIKGEINPKSHYEIYDNIGQLVLSGLLQNETNVAHLSNGFYFIKIANGDLNFGTTTFEIIK
jgi:hypothetical protein